MNEILISAIVGIVGIAVGAFINSIYSILRVKKEAKLRVIEKILDKRINAHDEIIEMTKYIRNIDFTGADANNNIEGFPIILKSRKDFDNYYYYITQSINNNTQWFNSELEKKLNLFTDYLINLFKKIDETNDQNIQKIGILIKQDFINFSSQIENLAFDFYRVDIFKLTINKYDKWHKYPKEKTLNYLNETQLFKRQEDINEIISLSNEN